MTAPAGLAELRAAYEARQKPAAPMFVDVWEDGALVAEVRRPTETAGAGHLLRTLAAVGQRADVPVDQLADVIAAATVGLHARVGGELEPLTDEQGAPLVFGVGFGQAIGVPDLTSAQGAVFAAFTDGEPPDLDVVRLLAVAVTVAARLTARAPAALQEGSGS